MSNRSADALFQLVQSLQKWEKRNFKLYVKRNRDSDDLKTVRLFDALEKMKEWDEEALLKRLPDIRRAQLPNIKAALYHELLASLRLLATEKNIDIQLHEGLDHARILYNRGLYHQSLKVLEKIRELAAAHHQVSFLVQVFFLEKKIEGLHITRSLEDRAEQLSADSEAVNIRLQSITGLSNLALRLYGWYIRKGHVRSAAEEAEVRGFFAGHLPGQHGGSFYERLYYHQCYCWYAFIRLDFLQYYRHTRQWVDLFEGEPHMTLTEPVHYIKGLHNLLTALFSLRHLKGFDEVIGRLETLSESEAAHRSGNVRIQAFVYLYTAKINRHILEGSFQEGLCLIPGLEEKLEALSPYLDRHRVLVFYYKIASLYFGSGEYGPAIDYLNKIIHWKVDLREDLQCYARLLHLIAHFELGNDRILEYLIKNTYRFMGKMERLSAAEEELFRFLRRRISLHGGALAPALKTLYDRLLPLASDPLERRAFTYLDVLSWLESKIEGRPLQDIVRRKNRSGPTGGINPATSPGEAHT